MKHPLLSTDAKRKAWAKLCGQIASEELGESFTLSRDNTPVPNEYRGELRGFETINGPVAYVAVEVCPLGVHVFSKFGFPQFAPAGANRFSGKWNHYFFPKQDGSREAFAATLDAELRSVLRKLKPLPLTRHDRPGMADYWAYEREQFAKQRTA